MSQSQPPDGAGPPGSPSSSGGPWHGAGRRVRRAGPSKAGRDLPAATGVGLALLVVVLVGLFLQQVAFVAVVAAFMAAGVWEVSRVLADRGARVPLVPAIAGTIAMPFAAFYGGAEALFMALVLTSTAILLWSSLDTAAGAAKSIMSGVLAVCWVPFLTSFAVLLLHQPDGALKVATLLLLVVSNDTFGYLVGVIFGRHPMAPKVSPKKSWEGFAGSLGGAMIVGVLAAMFLLGQPWWFGVVLAAAVVAAATAGDLAESMVKRELGIKDMSNILPGHGGVMDRLDSIVFSSPIAFLLCTLLIPGQL